MKKIIMITLTLTLALLFNSILNATELSDKISDKIKNAESIKEIKVGEIFIDLDEKCTGTITKHGIFTAFKPECLKNAKEGEKVVFVYRGKSLEFIVKKPNNFVALLEPIGFIFEDTGYTFYNSMVFQKPPFKINGVYAYNEYISLAKDVKISYSSNRTLSIENDNKNFDDLLEEGSVIIDENNQVLGMYESHDSKHIYFNPIFSIRALLSY